MQLSCLKGYNSNFFGSTQLAIDSLQSSATYVFDSEQAIVNIQRTQNYMNSRFGLDIPMKTKEINGQKTLCLELEETDIAAIALNYIGSSKAEIKWATNVLTQQKHDNICA